MKIPEDAIPREVDWDEPRTSKDWRDYVPNQVRLIWHTFNPKQRFELFLWADGLYEDEGMY
jgi:hypothetical protein